MLRLCCILLSCYELDFLFSLLTLPAVANIRPSCEKSRAQISLLASSTVLNTFHSSRFQQDIVPSEPDKWTFSACTFCFPISHHMMLRGGGTPLFGLYGYVSLDRVWFFGLAILNRVYNLTCLCQVKNLS